MKTDKEWDARAVEIWRSKQGLYKIARAARRSVANGDHRRVKVWAAAWKSTGKPLALLVAFVRATKGRP